MTTADVVASFIAAVALVVSIFTLWLQRRDKRPRLLVQGRREHLRVDDHNERIFRFDVANAGERALKVTGLNIDFKDHPYPETGARIGYERLATPLEGSDPLPCLLAPGDQASYGVAWGDVRRWIPRDAVGDVPIVIEATDMLRNVYRTDMAVWVEEEEQREE